MNWLEVELQIYNYSTVISYTYYAKYHFKGRKFVPKSRQVIFSLSIMHNFWASRNFVLFRSTSASWMKLPRQTSIRSSFFWSSLFQPAALVGRGTCATPVKFTNMASTAWSTVALVLMEVEAFRMALNGPVGRQRCRARELPLLLLR